MSRIVTALTLFVTLLGVSTGAHAVLITNTIGNGTPGFSDGDTPTVPVVGAAQAGQPAPFDQGYGTDGLFGGNFSVTWTFNYAALADPILDASLTIGIADHDSSASGSQLGLLTVDGTDLTAGLDALFEAGGGSADGEYNVYTLDLAALLAPLVDGSVTVALDLAGPGLVTPLFPLPGPNPPQEVATNGANLIFSRLEITTQDAQPIPEPATWGLVALGLGAVSWYRRHLGVGTRQR